MEEDLKNLEKLQEHRFFLFMVIALSIVAVFFYVDNYKLNKAIILEQNRTTALQKTLTNLLIEAKAVSVYNATKDKKIYGKNDNIAMPLASLAKTMTVITALNGISKEGIVNILPEAVKQSGDYGLYAHEKWKAGDLAQFTLVSSSNDGAYALSFTYDNFLERMNTKAKKIGMDSSLFLNPTGLDIDLEHGSAFASASDANKMALYGLLAYPEIFKATTLPEINLRSESGFEHSFKNTDLILDKIPNLVFSKTGFTEIAGGNLTVVFRDKRGDLIAVTVMGSSFEGRFNDMEKLVDVL